ncbi:hypothetical protein ACJX0J_012554, partial [Zea mays]
MLIITTLESILMVAARLAAKRYMSPTLLRPPTDSIPWGFGFWKTDVAYFVKGPQNIDLYKRITTKGHICLGMALIEYGYKGKDINDMIKLDNVGDEPLREAIKPKGNEHEMQVIETKYWHNQKSIVFWKYEGI